MRVLRLHLQDFRSWPRLALEAHSGTNLLLGRNGAGKSNVLEALHLCALGFSPRTRSEKDLVRWGAERFYCRLEGSREDRHLELGASCDLTGRKEIRVDGETGRLFSRLVGHISVVGLYPEDLEIVRGAPEARRSFLDALLSQRQPDSVEILREYARVVRQRNAALKDPERFGGSVREVLDRQMVDLAVPILMRRIALVDALVPAVTRLHAELSGNGESADLWYRGSYGDEDLPSDAVGLTERLESRQRRVANAESQAGTTLFGPHRDDLLLMLDARPARETASQGQARSLAIALRLAAAELLGAIQGREPVLLLDDVFAELDGPRRERLAALLPRGRQSFLCSPRRADLPFSVDRTFVLEGGALKEVL
ncbi:MAG: DNA replication and repair protein RecF [Fibrobacteria bacterium]|nr:DNA replication and repair protein RecF [Fibrobacteria bacterium]